MQGAENMAQMELLLNAYASKTARNHCAEFVGYCEVAEDEATARLTPGGRCSAAGSDTQAPSAAAAARSLTRGCRTLLAGLWLMWKFEGSRTLSYYLRRRDTLRALASDLEISEDAVVATVMKQLLEGLAVSRGPRACAGVQQRRRRRGHATWQLAEHPSAAASPPGGVWGSSGDALGREQRQMLQRQRRAGRGSSPQVRCQATQGSGWAPSVWGAAAHAASRCESASVEHPARWRGSRCWGGGF